MADLLDVLAERVLLCDGGTGSRVQAAGLHTEHDYCGHENCTEILVDSRPVPPEDVREVMENIAKYGFIMPAEVIGMLALRIAPAFSGVSP